MRTVTLTTDFGTADGYVGAMKGVIASLAPAARLVDISHQVPRHDIAAGAFALAQAAPLFPAGTVHLAVVDPGVGGARAPVVVGANGQLFVAPDNGLLSLVAPQPDEVYAIRAGDFRRPQPSATFHGRDIFAVAAGRLAAGAAAADAGPPVELLGALAPVGDSAVVHVDGFGNLITNIPASVLPARPRFHIGDRLIDGLATTFESVDPGELVAYVGSGNTLEIAVREGSAAVELNVGRGSIVTVSGGGA